MVRFCYVCLLASAEGRQQRASTLICIIDVPKVWCGCNRFTLEFYIQGKMRLSATTVATRSVPKRDMEETAVGFELLKREIERELHEDNERGGSTRKLRG